MSTESLFVFEPYRLDVRERQLLRGPDIVSLPPKLFDLLAELVQNSGRLLQKQELLDRVWGDVAVEEGSLTRGVSALRRVLGEAPQGGDFIQTVAKQGYRFVPCTMEPRPEPVAGEHRMSPPPSVLQATSVAFVGRDSELAELHAGWQRAVTGRRQLLLVAGEPGIGKTRLAFEFARQRAAEGAAVLVGCSDQEALIPYQPFVEALTWYFRICPDGELRRQVEEGGASELGTLIPDLRRRQPDLPHVDAMNAEGQRYRLFETVAATLSLASQRRPLVLVLDDLHWADEATLFLLRHVMRSPRASALAIVATYRENELGRTHPLAETLAKLRLEPGVTRLVLHGLDVAGVQALMTSIVGVDAHPQLAGLVLRATEGNPFFAAEMLRHLCETGAIAADGRAPRDPDLAAVGLSEGIKDVIGRRLSRLSETCNRVLAIAAVIGREFDVGILEAVADVTEDALLDALEEAERAQIVRESAESGDRVIFMHALIRDTLYGELSSPRRIRLHKRVGEAIERLAVDSAELALGDLAYHFTQAAAAGVTDKAVRYATAAGNQAADALAHEDAARFYEMALQVLDLAAAGPESDALREDVHARRARAFDALNRWKLEIKELEAALTYVAADNRVRRCEIALELARAWFLLLDLRPVRQYAGEALRLADELQRPDLAANALAWTARCLQAEGDVAAAIETDRKAIARAAGVPATTHMLGPLSLYLAGQPDEALALARTAADAARSSRDTTFVMYALAHLGLALTGSGRYAEAAEVFTEVRAFGRKYGAQPMLARATAMAGGLHLALYDFAGAEALQQEACDLARSAGFAPPLVSARIDALFTHARDGEPGRAEALLEETASLAASTAGWHEWLWDLRLTQARAEIALARGAFDAAAEAATVSIEKSRRKRRPKYEALGLVTRSRALEAIGRRPEAIADARRACDTARPGGDPIVQLLALDARIAVDGSDDVLAQAMATIDRIRGAVPDAAIRRAFERSEIVSRLARA